MAPVNFTPYLGWADATDVNNIPNGFRLISAADLLRYENFGKDAQAAITTLESDVTKLKAPLVPLVKTTSYAIAAADHLVVGNGASLTMTLPSAATSGAGKVFRLKNIHSSALTVASASGTIDGAATKSLAQWASATYVSNGTVWYSI